MKIYTKVISVIKNLIWKGCVQLKEVRNLPSQFYCASFTLQIYPASFEVNIERSFKITADIAWF